MDLLSTALLSLLAMLLKAKTNHRGLGGATFGIFGAAGVCVCALVVARLTRLAAQADNAAATKRAWLVRGGLGVLVLGALIATGLPLVLSGSADGDVMARAAIFDMVLALAVVGFLLPRRTPRALALPSRTVALPLALCIVVVGFVRIETSEAATFVRQGGGAVASVLSALEAWTDRDGDGEGSHFGGSDCDEGDPRRHPTATDTLGDGIDQDCDGADGAVTHAVAAKDPAATPTGNTSSTTTATSAATVPASAPKSPTSDVTRPDVVLVTLDTVRADRTSVYGYDKKTTPNLEKLAARAMVFERAYAPGSTTQRGIIP